MLLCASNYSLRLSACDIDRLMCLLCELSGWLYIPWLVMPSGILIAEFQTSASCVQIECDDSLWPAESGVAEFPALQLFS